MNNKHLLQTMFALCTAALFTTSCTNDALTSPQDGNGDDNAIAVLNLGLPQGDEVNYTRGLGDALADDNTEWAIKTMKVYHFSTTQTTTPTATDYALVKAYDLPVTTAESAVSTPGSGQCLDYGNGEYQIRISLRSNSVGDDIRHKFVVIVNDVCNSFDQTIETTDDISTIKLSALKSCIADKQLTDDTNSTDLFMGANNGLCMTGETGDLTMKRGHNDFTAEGDANKITLTRIMARLDVKSFLSASNVFVLKSVALKYSGNYIAPKGYLFDPGAATTANNIWYDNTRPTMEVTQNSKYDAIGFPDYNNHTTEEDWIAETSIKVTLDGGTTVTRQGTWYKKVLYMYPFPVSIGNLTSETPKLVVNYTLNGAPGVREVPMKDETTTFAFDIQRNYVYTLQVGDPNATGDLSFTFIRSPWEVHQIDADLNEGSDVK